MEVNSGTAQDADAIIQLIHACDRLEPPPRPRNISKNEWIKHGFGNDKAFHVLVARDTKSADGQILGFAAFFYLFSTWEGWSMFIDDLLVLPDHKDCGGIKRLLLKECRKIAVDEGCARVQLEVGSAQAQDYVGYGAAVLPEWVTVRLSHQHLTAFVGRKDTEVYKKFKMRLATVEDMPSVLYLVQCLAEDEKEPNALRVGCDVFEEGLLGKTRSYRCYLAEIENPLDTTNGVEGDLLSSKMPRNKHIVGMALYLTMFCKREGRVLHLEDLYVLPQYRNQGVGTELMRLCGQDGLEQGCLQMDWQVLKWKSRAIDLYKKLNGDFLSEYSMVRFSGGSIASLAEAQIV